MKRFEVLVEDTGTLGDGLKINEFSRFNPFERKGAQ